MKKSITILFVLVAILFGWLSYACYCDLRFDSDSSAGLIVAALGVMVTALVGWQVFNAIEIRSIINRVDKVKVGLDTLANEHRNKISQMEWLLSALHGTTFERENYQGGDTAYFLHCLDVVGNFIKSGSPLDSPPFVDSLRNMEYTFQDIKKRNNCHEIIKLGGSKDFVRKWYQETNKIIETEVQHLSKLKNRINKVYEDYIILTKDVKITPQNQTK